MAEFPKAFEIYRHFKGNLYQIIALAEHSETGEMQVVYQGLQAPYKIYVRPLAMFLEDTDKQKYPEAKQEKRFEKMEEKEQVKESVPVQEPILQIETETNYYDAEEVLEPLLLDFLDSDTYEEKLNILVALHHKITDDMINTMAMAIDVEVNEGKLEDKYEALRSCLITLQRYECNRLR